MQIRLVKLIHSQSKRIWAMDEHSRAQSWLQWPFIGKQSKNGHHRSTLRQVTEMCGICQKVVGIGNVLSTRLCRLAKEEKRCYQSRKDEDHEQMDSG